MRKILCGVLALIICSYAILTYAEDTNVTNVESSQNDTNSSGMTNLQNQQQELQNQIQNSNEKLEEVQEELTENLQQVQKLDEKIEQSEKELTEINEKVQSLTESTDKLEEKLKVAKENYEKQKSILEARLVAMYEAGETQYLDVLLSSTSLTDFLSNYFLITEIATYDSDLLEEVENKKEILELAEQKLKTNLKQLSTIKQNQLKISKVLQNTKTLRENYISKLSEKEQGIQAKIDEYKTRFEEVNREILALATSEGLSAQYIGGVMAWPVPGHTRISSNYGMRTHPITGVYKLHTGVDISAPLGVNFVAANDGIVTKASYNSAYGNIVIIDHGGGISTLYAHGSEILVQVGQTVTRGEPILKVGSTGYSTGPHAHFEVRINGVVTNPIEYITSNKIPESNNDNSTQNTQNVQNTENKENTQNTQNTENKENKEDTQNNENTENI